MQQRNSLSIVETEASTNFSILTPSMAQKASKAFSVSTNHIHASNPNPQAKQLRFRSVNQIGLDLSGVSDQEKRYIDKLKFGKKVIFGKQSTNKEILEQHLNTVHDHLERKYAQYEATKKEEKSITEKILKEAQLKELDKQK